MTFAEWWYDYKIKTGLLSHVDRFIPHAEAAWNAAQAQRAEVVPQSALRRAAYALFQLKRFVDMPQAAIDFCREEHAAACAVLDGDDMNKQP